MALARARAQGQRLGRPRRRIDPEALAGVAGLTEREAALRQFLSEAAQTPRPRGPLAIVATDPVIYGRACTYAALRRSTWCRITFLNLRRLLALSASGEFFHAVLTSAIVAYDKPHACMFEAAPEQTVPGAPGWMMGDSVEFDCVPATSFGAKAILVRTETPFDRRAQNLWAALDMIES